LPVIKSVWPRTIVYNIFIHWTNKPHPGHIRRQCAQNPTRTLGLHRLYAIEQPRLQRAHFVTLPASGLIVFQFKSSSSSGIPLVFVTSWLTIQKPVRSCARCFDYHQMVGVLIFIIIPNKITRHDREIYVIDRRFFFQR